MDKLPRRNLKFKLHEVLDLPELTVIYDNIEGNKLMVTSMRFPETEVVNQVDGYDGTSNFNVGDSIHHNIRCLTSDVYDQFQHVAEGEVTGSVFDYVPVLNPRMIDKSYETVKSRMLQSEIDVNTVLFYFSASPPSRVFQELLLSRLQEIGEKREPGHLPERFKFDRTAVEDIVSKEKTSLLTKLKGLREEMKSRGLDQIDLDLPRSVLDENEVLRSVYGEYQLDH